jgi:hypothetical protein
MRAHLKRAPMQRSRYVIEKPPYEFLDYVGMVNCKAFWLQPVKVGEQ